MAQPRTNVEANMSDFHNAGQNKMFNWKNIKETNSGMTILGIVILGILAIIVIPTVVLKTLDDDNKTPTTNQVSASTSQPNSSLSASLSLLSNVAPILSSISIASPHSLAIVPTIENLLSSITSTISAITPTLAPEATPMPTSIPTPKLQPSPVSQPLTSAPAYLSPGAACTADSQCSPNICYTEPNTATYCCGPSIMGCPGWTCTDLGHRDCKDPFTCNFQASTCG